MGSHSIPNLIGGILSSVVSLTGDEGMIGWRLLSDRDWLLDGL